MRILMLGWVVAAAMGTTWAADDAGTAIDLPGLDTIAPGVADDSLVQNTSLFDADGTAGAPRFYLSGIVGGSFATLTQPDLPDSNAILNQTILTGGGAAGWAFDRPYGYWRAEFEARSRERMQFTEIDPVVGFASLHLYDGWSTMANLWRDITISERAGIYLGGGVGAGGYRFVVNGELPGSTVDGSTGITSFAWTAGGGATYAICDRVTLDLGYRFFSLSPGIGDVSITNDVGTVTDTVKSQFAASELLLSVRIYEPFRRWR